MKIHEVLEPYYKYAKKGCPEDKFGVGCGCQWVSCGPGNSCLDTQDKIPCSFCGFWSGRGMNSFELGVYCVLLQKVVGIS